MRKILLHVLNTDLLSRQQVRAIRVKYRDPGRPCEGVGYPLDGPVHRILPNIIQVSMCERVVNFRCKADTDARGSMQLLSCVLR